MCFSSLLDAYQSVRVFVVEARSFANDRLASELTCSVLAEIEFFNSVPVVYVDALVSLLAQPVHTHVHCFFFQTIKNYSN